MHPLITGTLIILLLIAVWQDIRYYRIPNILVLPGAIIGVLSQYPTPTGNGRIWFLDFASRIGGRLSGVASTLSVACHGCGRYQTYGHDWCFCWSAQHVNYHVIYFTGRWRNGDLGVVLLRGRLIQITGKFKAHAAHAPCRFYQWQVFPQAKHFQNPPANYLTV